MAPINWHFIAGYFEGEASIGYYRQGKTTCYLALSIVSCNKALLEDIRASFGHGSVTRANKIGSSIARGLYRRRRTVWRFRLSGQNAIDFARQIICHLTEHSSKKIQVETVLSVGWRASETTARRLAELKKSNDGPIERVGQLILQAVHPEGPMAGSGAVAEVEVG